MTAKTSSRSTAQVLSIADRNVLLEYAGLINHGHIDIVEMLAQEFVSGAKTALVRAKRLAGLGELVRMVKGCEVLLDNHIRQCWSGSGVSLDRNQAGDVVITKL